MLSTKQLLLLKLWKNLFEEYTVSELVKLSKRNTKTWVFNSLKLLEKKKLITKKRKSNLDLYSLNFQNPFLFHCLQYLNIKDTYKPILNIPHKNYCLIESNNKLILLIDERYLESRFTDYFNCKVIFYTYDEFEDMLIQNDSNAIKIFNNNTIYYNPDIYYKIILNAHKRGFKLPR